MTLTIGDYWVFTRELSNLSNFLLAESRGLCAERHTDCHTFEVRKTLTLRYSHINHGLEPRASSLLTAARSVLSLLVVDQQDGRWCTQEARLGYIRRDSMTAIPTRVVCTGYPPPSTIPTMGERATLCAYTTPTMGERAALCATVPPPWENGQHYAQQYPHHGREASTLRNSVPHPWERLAVCATGSFTHGRHICAEGYTLRKEAYMRRGVHL